MLKRLPLVLMMAIGSVALADGDHPDIELELEGSTLEIHGPGVLHNHEHYEFVQPGAFWQTFHDSNNWPGVEGEFTPADAGTTFNLNVTSPLYYWDTIAGSFSAVTDDTSLFIADSGLVNDISIAGSTVSETLNNIASVNGSGGVHTHPVWRLFGDDGNDPLDGAYLILFNMSSSNVAWDPSDTHALLFHKGLTEEQYYSALVLAGSQFGLTIPEPASLLLVGAGATLIGLRRRSRQA